MSEVLNVKEPVPISLVGEQYLVFDVNVVSYLRRVYHICGSSIGTLPQIPQQNLFLGLPIELMKEEARLLVEKNAAYVINDTHLHRERFGIIHDEERNKYIKNIRSKGLEVSQLLQAAQRERSQMALARRCNAKQHNKAANTEISGTVNDTAADCIEDSNYNDGLGTIPDRNSNGVNSTVKSPEPYAITPTTSYLTYAQKHLHFVNHNVPSYALYKYLHNRDYFILPGLRFGCDYNVYPGDPLRFHSHFIAVGYEWEQEIPIFDIIGGGRLATAVKKGFLIGGSDSDSNEVRTFSVEWGGM